MAAGAGGDATQRNRHVVPGPGTRVDTSPAPVIPAAALDRIASHGGKKKGVQAARGAARTGVVCGGRVAAPRDGTWWSRRGAGARRGWLWRGVRRFIGPVRALRAVRWWPASLSPGCASAPLLAFVVLAAGTRVLSHRAKRW